MTTIFCSKWHCSFQFGSFSAGLTMDNVDLVLFDQNQQ